ncbi:cupin domain-containing protein [Paraburkholderia sp. SOS3]|uniref:cupin domain-containing protein n=1 Tax=Paraburkholderia sp. SOS3 TaxID=1926494 RepID=UPI0009475909|nr:cupin domain-containing protein [Paraburkholderia sp. SOS3]APR36229.1 cupin [Paraburkholderia sp. SOS3]
MKKHWTKAFATASATLALATLAPAASQAQEQTEVLKPVKVTKPEINGAIFERKDAVHENKDGNATTDVVTFTSKDNGYQTGLYKSGPLHEVISKAPGYPYNEFLYFISGGATFTSADGSVVAVHAGEAVSLPKGWVGTFDTKGYTKLYVTYNPDDVRK